jgi:hypothetical protein
VEQFTATPGTYIVDLDDLGSMGADATVKLNGVVIMEGRGTTGEVGPRHYMVSVTLSANNVLEINLRGKKGSVLQVKICPASASQCYPDLPAPELVLQSTTVDGNSVHSALDVPITHNSRTRFSRRPQTWSHAGSKQAPHAPGSTSMMATAISCTVFVRWPRLRT